MAPTSSNSSDLDFLGLVSALCLCCFFGANAVAIKISIAGLGSYLTAGARFLIASVLLVIWARFSGRSLSIKKSNWAPLLIISLGFSIQLLLFYTGIGKTTASRTSLIINLQPFFVLLLAHFFIPGDRINLSKILGIIFAFSGMVVIFFDNQVLDSQLRTGDFLVLLGAFIWSCNAVYTKNVIKHYSALQITLYPMIFSIPVSFGMSLLMENDLNRYIDLPIFGAMFYQSIITASFCFVAWNSLLKKHGAVALNSIIFIMPIVGVALGGFILDEVITMRLLLGLILVVIGLLIIHFKLTKPIRPIFNISRNS